MSILAHEKPILEAQKTLQHLKEQQHSLIGPDEVLRMEERLEKLKQQVYAKLSPWDRISICRHSQRPHALDYIQNLAEEVEELSGDRTFKNDRSIIAVLAKVGGQRCMIIGQEKGKDTESRIERNFGMPHPEGYRKALRCMKLAEKFHLPVICLLDTPGAYPGLAAEERGQGWAIAKNLFEMARLKTPVIILVIGEGTSGGALGIGVGDVVAVLEHAYYSVISPEGCASILWKDASKNELAASTLKMHAEELLKLGVIDEMIPEPPGGAHTDPDAMYRRVKEFLLGQIARLTEIPSELLIENRYRKFRQMGKYAAVAPSGTAQ